MKLQKKYFTVIFILFFLMSVALSLTSYFLSNNILLKKYKELSIEKLSYINEITDRELIQLNKSLVFISSNTLVIDRIQKDYSNTIESEKLYDDRKVNDILNALSTFEIFNAVNLMYIYGDNGEKYWYKVAKLFLEEEKIENTITNSLSINKDIYYMGLGYSSNKLNSRQKVLKFRKILNNEHGKKIGIIYLELNINYFKKIFSNEKINSDSNVYLIDNYNNLVFHPQKEFLGSKFLKNNRVLTVTSNLLHYDWKIISESSLKSVLSESYTIIKATISMAVISTIISIILIGFISGRIVRPIKNLIFAMNKVKDGDLAFKVEYNGHDEIRELTDIFNKMTIKLKSNLEHDISIARSLNDAEYKALQAQINPHFMYNSLNSLKWLAEIQNAHNITEIVDALWKLLKITSSLKGQFIKLKSEIDVIEAYATIQQVRYKGKFSLEYEIEEKHKDYIIPKFILQPIVENSIFHGIEPKKGIGKILISTKEVKNDLHIIITDDGVGIDIDKVESILIRSDNTKHHEGFNNIGMKNVYDRLRLLYGPNYGIIINTNVESGAQIVVKIPIILN